MTKPSLVPAAFSQLFMGRSINLLTSTHTDPVTHTPAFKEISVHMTVLPEIGVSPLPRTNSRWGHPRGVKVERKWQRADYLPPNYHSHRST